MVIHGNSGRRRIHWRQKVSRTLAQSARGIVTGVVLLGAFSCAKKDDKTSNRYTLACGPQEHHASYLNPLDVRQIVKIRYDAGFSDDEVREIERAVESWNQYSTSSFSGRPLFQLEKGSTVSSQSLPQASGDCAFNASEDGFGIALVTDANLWKNFGLTDNNPAVTVRCHQGREFVSKQVIMVNAKVIREGTGRGLFETIMKHEVGHSIGLDHSCDLSEAIDSERFVGCSAAKAIPEYFEAVMWPVIRAQYNELNSNDELRASCILGASE